MRATILLLLSFCTGMVSQAQNSPTTGKVIEPYNKCWQLEFTTGANFDLTHSSSNPTAKLLNTRPETAPMFAVRMNHLFAKKWGWYANMQINFYEEKELRGQSFLEKGLKEVMDDVFPGMRSLHPSLDAGVLYRIENKRFKLYPSLGIGYNAHLSEATAFKSSTTNNVNKSTSYTQDPGYLALKIGLTGNYYLSQRGFLVVRAGFQQPLQKTSVCLTHTEKGVETERFYYDTITAGRDLTLSIGYGFAFGRKR